MRHMILCVSGWSGTGKDELMRRAVDRHGAVQTGLADPAKRHLSDLYGFTEEQMFGPSASRNAGDPRHPKNVVSELGMEVRDGCYSLALGESLSRLAAHVVADRNGWADLKAAVTAAGEPARLGLPTEPFTASVTDPRFSLSPREALQIYCEKMNDLCIDTWVSKGMKDQSIIAVGGATYTRAGGLGPSPGHWNPRTEAVTGFADFRHIHEVRYARRAATSGTVPVLVRVKRPSVPKAPFNHRSEVEQARIRDAAFDFVVDNNKGVGDLHYEMDKIIAAVSSPAWSPKLWDQSHILSPGSAPEAGYAP